MKKYIFVCIIAAFTGCSENKKEETAAPVKIDSAAILVMEKAINNYKSLSEYFDSGKVIISFYNNKYPFKKALIFRTAFKSSNHFNFEYYELGRSNSMYVINQDGEKVQSWWGITNELKMHTSITSPLAAATGVSSSTSNIIPPLLNMQMKGKRNFINRLVRPVLNGKELLNGQECYKISDSRSVGNSAEIWIGVKDLMIHKIITDREVKNFNVKTTYQFYPYKPRLIKEELFTFRPYREVEL